MKTREITIACLTALLFSLILGWSVSSIAEISKECHVKIEGMTCGLCAAKIKKRLKGLVLSSDIDIKKGSGRFTYAEGKTSCKELAKKITETGFKASIE